MGKAMVGLLSEQRFRVNESPSHIFESDEEKPG